jgi:hypothetical protein
MGDPKWLGAAPVAWRLLLGVAFVLSGLAARLLHWVQRPDSAMPPREFTVVAVYLGLVFAGYALLVLPVDAWAKRGDRGCVGQWVRARVRQGVGFYVGGSLAVMARVLLGASGGWALAGVWLVLFVMTAWIETHLAPGGRAEPWRRTLLGWAWLVVGLGPCWWWIGHRGLSAELGVVWLAVALGVWMVLGRRWGSAGWMWAPSVVDWAEGVCDQGQLQSGAPAGAWGSRPNACRSQAKRR